MWYRYFYVSDCSSNIYANVCSLFTWNIVFGKTKIGPKKVLVKKLLVQTIFVKKVPLKVGKSAKIMIFMKIFLLNFYRFFTFFIAKLQHKIINLTKLKEKFKFFLFLVVFLFEKWTQNFQNFWIVCADFPPLALPCFYDLSYGRRLDPNT